MPVHGQLIGLYSPVARSGKGEFAHALASIVQGTSILSFADVMREAVGVIVSEFFPGGEAEAHEWLQDDRKDTKPIPVLGVTLRHIMQTLGTEWGRTLIHPDLWVLNARSALRRRLAGGATLVIFDDMRFENEFAMLQKEGANLIRITRKDAPQTAEHPSNGRLEGMPFHHIITNDGEIEDLRLKALAVAWDMGVA